MRRKTRRSARATPTAALRPPARCGRAGGRAQRRGRCSGTRALAGGRRQGGLQATRSARASPQALRRSRSSSPAEPGRFRRRPHRCQLVWQWQQSLPPQREPRGGAQPWASRLPAAGGLTHRPARTAAAAPLPATRPASGRVSWRRTGSREKASPCRRPTPRRGGASALRAWSRQRAGASAPSSNNSHSSLMRMRQQ